MIRLRHCLSFALVCTACSTEPGGDVSGAWEISESVTTQGGVSCQLTGDLILSQASNGSRFTGQDARKGSCTGAPTGFDPSGVVAVLAGEVSGDKVTFEIDFCDYTGTLAEPDMSGTLSCSDGIGGLPGDPATGTWQATRSVP
jgi:hypothetical protein